MEVLKTLISFCIVNLVFFIPYVFVGIVIYLIFIALRKSWRKSKQLFFVVLVFILSILIFIVSLSNKVIIPHIKASVLKSFVEAGEDKFGKDLVIPPDLQMEEPIQEKVEKAKSSIDSEGVALIEIFSKKDKWPTKPTINTNIDVLDMFTGEKKNILIRHLATSAKWYLSEKYGKLYAYRRFITRNGRWKNSLHGHYGSYDFDRRSRKDHFQFRIVFGIDGGPMRERYWRNYYTVVKTGSGEMALKVKKSANPGYKSYLVLESAGPTAEIFEEAETKQRPFTPLALLLIENELKALAESSYVKEKGFDETLMPKETIKKGEPEIYIVGHGGIYLVYAYVNPGESGYVYLKVFEETKNTPLSVHPISRRSNEYIGWSDNPKDQFFYNTQISVYEGDWGTHYPARFELWFVPKSGEPERKLIEKVFKIEGWQR